MLARMLVTVTKSNEKTDYEKPYTAWSLYKCIFILNFRLHNTH